jgi:hypothetical protein
VREIVRRYHEAQANVLPFDMIEFERQLHVGAGNDYAYRDGDNSAVAERPAAAAGLLVLRGPSARAKRHRTKEQMP